MIPSFTTDASARYSIRNCDVSLRSNPLEGFPFDRLGNRALSPAANLNDESIVYGDVCCQLHQQENDEMQET